MDHNEWEEINKEEFDEDIEKYEYKKINSDKNYCYDSIQRLYKHGMKQINIHICVSDETLDQVYETFNDYLNGEERLKGLNAIVLLSLKKKGRGKSFNTLDNDKFGELVDFALKNDIPIGFDSCSANKLLNSLNKEDRKEIEPYIEPCESTLFSAYINCHGEFFLCSFTEGEKNWKSGINMLAINDFVKDVWYNKRTMKFREDLLKNKRNCVFYNI
jgi:hypothetical protein